MFEYQIAAWIACAYFSVAAFGHMVNATKNRDRASAFVHFGCTAVAVAFAIVALI